MSGRLTYLDIRNIRGEQPEGFRDKVFTKGAPILLGSYSNRLETETEVTLKGETDSMIETVQSTFYPKYKLQFIVTGEYYLEQIVEARQIFVKTQGRADHDAKVMDEITREHLGSNAYKCEMTYYDKAARQCADNLKSSIIKDILGLDLWRLEYGPGKYIYTRINPDTISPDPTQESLESNFVKKLTRNSLKKAKTFVFYINTEDLLDFQDNVYTYTNVIDGLGPQIEPFMPVITKLSGYDIYKIQIDFIYDIKNEFI